MAFGNFRIDGRHHALSLPPRLLQSCTLAVLMLCTGCVTTAGYVPEYPKPASWGETPELKVVKTWAMDVLDGYDSRATMNRQADYASALLVAAGAASLVGLAAFSADTAWITGIPIGTAFVAGIAAVYSSEIKAEIYGLAANYLQRMINNSERRLTWLFNQNTDAKGDLLSGERKKAEEALSTISNSEEEYAMRRKDEVIKAVEGGSEEGKDAAKRDAANRAADDAKRQLDALAIERELAQERLESLNNLELYKEYKNGVTSDPKTFEALCLRDDVMDVMERVERLITLLMPSDVTESLQGVGSATGKSVGDWVVRKEIDQGNKDLVYLNSPIVSKCGAL